MTREEAVQAIYSRVVDNWSGTFTFENEQFTPPTGRWQRFTIRHGTSRQETLGAIGNRRFNRSFRLMVQFFDAPNAGRAGLDADSMAVQALFEGVSFGGGVNMVGESPIQELGVDATGRAQFFMEARGFYEEVR